MTHDFAKIKPEPLLERKTVATPPAWSLMFTGLIVGLTLGVFGCFLFYLSGNVPPLNINQVSTNNMPPVGQAATVVAAATAASSSSASAAPTAGHSSAAGSPPRTSSCTSGTPWRGVSGVD